MSVKFLGHFAQKSFLDRSPRSLGLLLDKNIQQFLGLAAFFVIILAALWTGWKIISSAPPASALSYVSIDPVATDVTLGYLELGQKKGSRAAGESRHLSVRFVNDQWQFANLAAEKKVELSGSLLGRWQIESGDIIKIGNQSIEVVSVDKDTLTMKARETSVRWDGGLAFSPDGTTTASCPAPKSGWWSKLIGDSRVLFHIGSTVNCLNKWAVPEIPVDAVRVVQDKRAFWLERSTPFIPILLSRKGGAGEGKQWSEIFTSLPDSTRLNWIVIGRTRFNVDIDSKTHSLRLSPSSGVDLFPPDSKTGELSKAGVKQVWTDRAWIGEGEEFSVWIGRSWISLLVPSLLFAVVAAILFRRGDRSVRSAYKAASIFTGLLVATAVMSLQLHRGFGLVGAIALAWIAWLLASASLYLHNWLREDAGRLWIVATAVAGFGCLVLLQMAAGAENNRWLKYAMTTSTAVSGFAVALLILSPFHEVLSRFIPNMVLMLNTGWPWRSRTANDAVAYVIVAGVVLLLVGQVAKGTAQGFWLFQPAEMAKTVIPLLIALAGVRIWEVMAKDHSREHSLGRAFARFALAPTILGIPSIILLGFVKDFSPILIIGTMLIIAFVLISPGPEPVRLKMMRHRTLVFFGIVTIALISIAVAMAMFRFYPESIWDIIPKRDRFLVWADLAHNTVSGYQSIMGMSIAAEGGWTGHWFGSNGGSLALPVVESDFILSFVLFKFGGLAAIALAMFQTIYIALFFRIGRGCRRWEDVRPNALSHLDRESCRILGNFFFLALAFLGTMQATHWGISWSNVLGIMPIMGQPMTWISYGVNHLLFFAFPALFLALVAGRGNHENIAAG